jgi:hypothetical protein
MAQKQNHTTNLPNNDEDGLVDQKNDIGGFSVYF